MISTCSTAVFAASDSLTTSARSAVVTTARAAQSASSRVRWRTLNSGLTGTNTAPAADVASSATTVSIRFSAYTATRSPRRMPSRCSPAANLATRSLSSR
jgi:hypothetical protein